MLLRESPPDSRTPPHMVEGRPAGAFDGTATLPDLASPDTYDLAEMAALSGAYVVRVEVGDAGAVRTYLYRSLGAAESAVQRAQARGRSVAVYLCTLSPVGPVVV